MIKLKIESTCQVSDKPSEVFHMTATQTASSAARMACRLHYNSKWPKTCGACRHTDTPHLIRIQAIVPARTVSMNIQVAEDLDLFFKDTLFTLQLFPIEQRRVRG